MEKYSTNQPRRGHPKDSFRQCLHSVSLTNRIQSYQLKRRESRSLSIRNPFKVAKQSEKVARSNEDLQPWQTHFLFSAHYIIPAKMNKTYFIYVYNTYMIHIGVAFIYIGTCRIYRLDICIDMIY